MDQDILLTVDAVIFSRIEGVENVLLVERKNPPFEGSWALPGGFVEEDEDLPDAAARELKEETSLTCGELKQIGAFGKPGRDPRGRVVTVAFMQIIESSNLKIKGGSDAATASWHPLDNLPDLAFDHGQIIKEALSRARRDPQMA